MKKNKLLWKACLGSLVPIFTVPIITSVSRPMINSEQIYFQGRKFNNTEEALKYLVQSQKIKVGNQKVLGDVNRSYINMETGQLNKDLLPNYDVSKMNFAYNTAGGGLTQDYKKAKRTYFNKGMILKRYDDGYGGDFLSSADASNSMRDKTIESKLGFVNVDYISPNGKGTIKKKLNPFNKEDIGNYKKNIEEHIFDIISNKISNGSGPYDIIVSGDNKRKPTIDLTQVIKNVWGNGIDGWNINETKDALIKNSSMHQVPFKFKTKKLYLGYGTANEKITGQWGKNSAGFNANDSLEVASFYWDNNYRIKFNNGQSMINFLNNSDFEVLTQKDKNTNWPTKKIVHFEIEGNSRNHINNTQICSPNKDDIKISSEKLKLKTLKGNLMSNDQIRDSLWKKIQDDVKNKINDIISNKATKYYMTKPNISAKYSSSGTYSYMHLSYNGDVDYTYTSTISLPTKYEINLIENSTPSIKSLLSWGISNAKESFDFTIAQNNRSLFDVNLSKSKDGKLVANVQLSTKNQGNVLSNANSGSSSPTPDLNTSDKKGYFYLLLKKINKSLNPSDFDNVKNKTPKAIRGILKGYFDKLEDDVNFKFDVDFVNSDPKMPQLFEFNESIKLYLNIIYNVYKEYYEFPKIIKRIASNIIDPKNILIVNNANGTLSKLKLGKYMIKSMLDFNAPVSNGTFSTSDLLATNRSDWSVIRNNVDFNPTLLIIVYDQNGERVNSDNYNYDNETILEFNSRLISEPRRNFEWIYVDGHHGPVENITTTIQYVTIDDHTLYFKTFRQLKEYMLKYILKHSTRG